MHWRKALGAALPARVEKDRLQAVAEVADAHNGIDACGDGKRQCHAQEELHLVDEQGLGQQAVAVEDNEPADDVCDFAQSQDLVVCELTGWSLVGMAGVEGVTYHYYDSSGHVLVFDREDGQGQEDEKSRDERHGDWELGKFIVDVDDAIHQAEGNEEVDFQLEKDQENLDGSATRSSTNTSDVPGRPDNGDGL
jgi:hypothetical protein